MPLRIGLVALAMIAVGALAPGIGTAMIQMAHNDRVHYGGHLLAGRILSLCPCTAELAETQYTRGLYHARTPREVALLTTERPTSMRQRVRETPILLRGLAHQITERLPNLSA